MSLTATSSGFFTSSVGRKYVMGVTGLLLSLFVLTHMAGNMLLFVSAEAYNTYSYKLITNPFIYVAEVGLLVLFLVHTFLGIKLTIDNKRARGTRFNLTTAGEKGVTFASKTMIYQGALILVFTILHLITFKYGTHYEVTYNGVTMRDLQRLVIEVFQSPLYIAWYCVAMVVLGLHLTHGFQSAFQSLGLNHPRYTPMIRKIGFVYAIVVAGGFFAQPIYAFLAANH